MTEPFEPPKYLSSLIAAINDGAKTAQTGALALAALGIYLAAVALSTTDEDLLMGQTTTITQLGVQVSPGVSFGISALVFVALHVFTLIRYGMLTTNLEQFRAELDKTVPVETNRDRCRQLLANVEFVVSRAVNPQSSLYSPLFGWIFVAIIAFFPVLVLLIQHLSALRYQDNNVDLEQHVAMLLELGALVWFFGRLRSATDTPDDPAWDKRSVRWVRAITALSMLPLLFLLIQYPVGLLRKNWQSVSFRHVSEGLGLTWNYWIQHLGALLDLGVLIWLYLAFTRATNTWLYRRVHALRPGYLLLLPIFIGLIEGWLLNIAISGDPVVVPDNRWSLLKQPLDHYPFCPQHGCRHLVVPGRFLISKVWKTDAVVALRISRYCEDKLDVKCKEVTEEDLAAVEGITLHLQALFRADLNQTSLIEASFYRAYLADANLHGSDLRGANLYGANLSGADLEGANLEKANLECANLAGANLKTGHLNPRGIRGAVYDAQTRFPDHFEPKDHGMILKGEPQSEHKDLPLHYCN